MANHSSILAWWATVHGVAESDMTEDIPLINVEIKIINKIIVQHSQVEFIPGKE